MPILHNDSCMVCRNARLSTSPDVSPPPHRPNGADDRDAAFLEAVRQRQQLIREGNYVPRQDAYDPFSVSAGTAPPTPEIPVSPAAHQFSPTGAGWPADTRGRWVSIPGYPGIEFATGRLTCGLCGDPAEHPNECSGRTHIGRPINCNRCGQTVAENGLLSSSVCRHSVDCFRLTGTAVPDELATRIASITVVCTFGILHKQDAPDQEQLRQLVHTALRKVTVGNSGKVGELRLISVGTPRRVPRL